MNLRDIKYLLTVAETCHFGRAAERCFISQPTLSGQIKKLEDELGVILFERTNRSVVITPIGEKILVHARLLLEQANAIQQLAHASRDPLSGSLRLGIIPTLSPYLLPLILAPLRQRYPQLKLVLSEEMTENLLKRLHAHEIDAALLATPATEPQDLVDTILFNEPFLLAHPHTHALHAQDNVTQEDLEKLDLLLLADGHCLTQQVMQVCQKAVAQQANSSSVDLRATSLETLLQLVGAGFGCTLVPTLAVSRTRMINADVTLRPLTFSNAMRQIRVVYRATYPHRSAVLAFAGIILDNLPDTVHIVATMRSN